MDRRASLAMTTIWFKRLGNGSNGFVYGMDRGREFPTEDDKIFGAAITPRFSLCGF
jgi:hypothetical protein